MIWAHGGFGGFGEAGSGMVGRIYKKPVGNGGQLVLVMDADCLRPRAYMHRNKIYDKLYKDLKKGWTKTGSFEMMFQANKLLTMVQGEASETKKLFRAKPTITADNFFQDSKIMEYLGGVGFGAIMTSARDRLPSDIKSQYLHKQQTTPKSKLQRLPGFPIQ